MPSETQRIDAALTHLAAQGETAAQIADTAVQTWHEIHTALSPVIGPRGVQALYRRTLYLTRSTHPWLASGREASGREKPDPDDYADLRAALAQQTSAVAAAAHGALLHHFFDLLTSLIGGSLTERLLRSVWDRLPSGDAAQDTTP